VTRSFSRGAITLRYEQTGSGPPAVLVHGWCCDHTFMAPIAEHQLARGYSVVTVDLRGHGQSDKPAAPYPIEVFADDLVWLCAELGLARPVLIGHSMGGTVVFDLALRHPGLASAIVMIDSPVAMSPAVRRSLTGVLQELRGPGFREALRSYACEAFLAGSENDDRKNDILEAMLQTPQHVVVSACEGMLAYDPRAANAHLTCPAFFIGADGGRPRCAMSALLDLAPALVCANTFGSNHFCQLEVPDQVNGIISRFLVGPSKRAALD
jgi:pimeloyl-ACP methyl ester carboxylesterase